MEISYFEKFGHGVPPNVGKFAANTAQGAKLDEMLREQVRKGEPVTDWKEFAEPLYAPYRVTP